MLLAAQPSPLPPPSPLPSTSPTPASCGGEGLCFYAYQAHGFCKLSGSLGSDINRCANATILIGNNSQLGDSNSLSDGDGKGTHSGVSLYFSSIDFSLFRFSPPPLWHTQPRAPTSAAGLDAAVLGGERGWPHAGHHDRRNISRGNAGLMWGGLPSQCMHASHDSDASTHNERCVSTGGVTQPCSV